MSLAESIGPHLQYLRRFSRALTGNQASGDAYVAATLETIVADPPVFDVRQDSRVELYRIFASLWNSVSLNNAGGSGQEAWEKVASNKLELVTPMARQVFLLKAVEGFEPKQIAPILSITEDEVMKLADQASSEIAVQVHTEVLIIEDEPLIALDIESLVTDLGHGVTGIARTHSEAIELVKQSPPGLVLADIQLADGSSGLDAVNEILQDFNVPVIFITAFPERLLTGERPEPAFLLTKPFLPEMVKAIISQALFFETNAGDPPEK